MKFKMPAIIIHRADLEKMHVVLGEGAYVATRNYEFLDREVVPECGHSHIISDGPEQSKCENCGAKYVLKSEWVPK